MVFRYIWQYVWYGTFVFLALAFMHCRKGRKEVVDNGRSSLQAEISTELRQYLDKHTLQLWYPASIDSAFGGFFSNFNYCWERADDQNKFIVTQARHVWAASVLYEFNSDERYLAYAHHGYEFIKNYMWDAEYGGFVQLVNQEGKVISDTYDYQKRAYGNAFGIYAMAAYYRVSGREDVLDMAVKAFHWFDQHAHDGDYGGYFEHLTLEGGIIEVSPGTPLSREEMLTGLKDYNSSIHIMEAFAELYKVWPDTLLHDRLEEMFHVVLDTMTADEGYLRLYFYPDWTHFEDHEIINNSGGESWFSDHITFGHDVETAYLLIETAETLGMHLTGAMQQKIKRLVDHPLAHGWDTERGGFYDVGKYIDGKMTILDRRKNWWAQAEGLNSLLLMSELYPEDPNDYHQRFLDMWKYIKDNLIDQEYGGWYSYGLDTAPDNRYGDKASIWKGNYHTTRSMINCITRLKGGTAE